MYIRGYGIFKRNTLSVFLIAVILVNILVSNISVKALDALVPVPMAPQSLSISEIGYPWDDPNTWHAKFKWTMPPNAFPAKVGEALVEDTYLEFYFDKVLPNGEIIEADKSIVLPTTITEFDTRTYGIKLDQGTIYAIRAKSFYTYEGSAAAVESGESNTVKFLTEISFNVSLISGTNHLKIVWDDVWDVQGRINYRMLISDTQGFMQPPPVPDIIGSNIGTGNVTVSGDKLEYIYTGASPGREYSIKIIPVVDPDVKVMDEDDLKVKKVKTEILLRTEKVGQTNDGGLWKLFWDPVITGSISNDIYENVYYKLYRYDENDRETFFAQIPNKEYFYIHVPKGEEAKYKYKVEALAVKADGMSVPFYSQTKVELKEQVPEYPEAPKLVDEFSDAAPEPLSFYDSLSSESATILWEAPISGEGGIDNDIYYDMWLLDDLNLLETLPAANKIADSKLMEASNKVYQQGTGIHIGYKYELKNLDSNTTYYFVIQAKKNYLIENTTDGVVISTPFRSETSVKVIITEPDSDADKPVAPRTGAFRVKEVDGIKQITNDSVEFQQLNKWHELYDDVLNQWNYVTEVDYQINEALPDGNPQKKQSRVIKYESGYSIVLKYIEYETANRLVLGRSIKYNDLSRPDIIALSQSTAPVVIPNYQDENIHPVDLVINNLKNNTTYIVWAEVTNKNKVTSEPSDPLIVTTYIDIPDILETPTVPTDLKGLPSDVFVDLLWGTKTGYKYEIKYGTEDDIEKADGSSTVTSEELQYVSYHRINELKADTTYYFWIRSVVTVGNETKNSEWSNPTIVTTTPYTKPDSPKGFGVKSVETAITKDSIDFEWLNIEGIQYKLEISDHIEFKDMKSFDIAAGKSEYKATGLLSNHKYYARLYAYDKVKDLYSEPTNTITVKTRRSSDDYDANVNNEEPIAGDIIEMEPIPIEGVWTIKIIGANADRFIREAQTDNVVDYVLELDKPLIQPEKTEVWISSKIFDGLESIGENLIIRMEAFELKVTPGMLRDEEYRALLNEQGFFNYKFVFTNVKDFNLPLHMKLTGPVTQIEGLMNHNQNWIGDDSFAKSAQYKLPMSKNETGNNTATNNSDVFLYDTLSGKWKRESSVPDYIKEKLIIESREPLVLATGIMTTSGYDDMIYHKDESALINVISNYSLKSVSGSKFRPDATATYNELIKMLLDVVPAQYTEANAFDMAIKSSIVESTEKGLKESSCTRGRAAALIAKAYQIKTGEALKVKNDKDFIYLNSSIKNYSVEIRNRIIFAVENNIVSGQSLKELRLNEPITRIEFVCMLERLLILCGEIDF